MSTDIRQRPALCRVQTNHCERFIADWCEDVPEVNHDAAIIDGVHDLLSKVSESARKAVIRELHSRGVISDCNATWKEVA